MHYVGLLLRDHALSQKPYSREHSASVLPRSVLSRMASLATVLEPLSHSQSSITVGVIALLRLLYLSEMDLFSVHHNIGRGLDTQSCLFPFESQQGDFDVIGNSDGLVGASREN
jgi:hypothetical protein